MKKRILALFVAAAAFLPTFGCNQGEETPEYKVTVWTATGTEKLMRDVDYSSRYGASALTINAFRNEYESAQIMISSEGAYEYEITPSALKSGDGTELPVSAFELYHEKYVNVTKIRDDNSPTSVGYYPDALIPMDAAVEYGENVLTGKNQGVWVTLNVPETQAAGVYSGEFTVKVNGQSFAVPVNVTVYDYTLSDEVHSKSSFAIGYEYLGWGELDTSIEMQEAYYEALLSYRLNGQNLPGNELVYVRPEGEALKRFLAYADKYTRDPRVSTFNLPFTMSSVVYNGATIKSVDFDLFAVLLKEMAAYSVEHKVNLFEKASTYFIFFDEYDLNGVTDTANYNLNKAVEVCESVAAELEGTLVCDDQEFLTETLKDLAEIKHKVVGNLTDGLQVEKAVSVPLISKYHTEESRARYTNFAEECFGDDKELWAYTCLEPRTPYPTYHIEDILLSSRLMGWMMYNYDIVGNLYWETTLYAWRESAFGDYQLQDYYEQPMRYPNTNGDGFLFYPGRDYGVYGPIGTLRLHSIRDGNEEYDLMYALEALYKQYGVEEDAFNELYKIMTQKLYTGTLVRIRDNLTDYFAQSRELLAQLLTLASNTGTVVKGVETNEGAMTITLSSENGVVLKKDGQTLTPSASGDRNEYTVTVNLSNERNYLNLTAEKEGKSYALKLDLGGKSVIVNAATLVSNAQVLSGGKAEADVIDGVNALKFTYDAIENEKDKLVAQINVKSLGVDENIGNVTVNVYSYGENAIDLKILSKCENSQSYIDVTEISLKKGWNKIVIPVTAFNCNNYGTLSVLRFNIGSMAQTEIAIGNIEIGG